MWWGQLRKLLPRPLLSLQDATLNLQDSSTDLPPLHVISPLSIGVFPPRRGGLFTSRTELGQTGRGKKRGWAASSSLRSNTVCWREVRWKGPASGFSHICLLSACWRWSALWRHSKGTVFKGQRFQTANSPCVQDVSIRTDVWHKSMKHPCLYKDYFNNEIIWHCWKWTCWARLCVKDRAGDINVI